MRFTIEQWAPDYGAAFRDADDADPARSVALDAERPAAEWAPIRPSGEPAATISFVDGVNRVDAQVWIERDGAGPVAGICATVAAGVVRCESRAEVESVRVERALVTAASDPAPILADGLRYDARASAAASPEELALDVMSWMRGVEADVARAARPSDLLVLDGLLWGREDVPNAIGYVKTQRASYLDADRLDVVSALQPGERTPLFVITSAGRSRRSWYLRLPGGTGHPWAGIVRCEASAVVSQEEAVALADRSASSLPRFASARHRDPRAPQNLYPIGQLERQLRRRSGDPAVVYRRLVKAAAPAGLAGLRPVPEP
ncbi:MAG TPA: hypothetical protein VGB83_04340 [Actinomycetota bacterium]